MFGTVYRVIQFTFHLINRSSILYVLYILIRILLWLYLARFIIFAIVYSILSLCLFHFLILLIILKKIFYAFRAAFSTIVVSLSCPLYVVVTFRFRAFWANKDRLTDHRETRKSEFY